MATASAGDRLSGVPDAALTAILCHLPTDDAVRTSVLSRRWRRVFATLPVVHLVDRRKHDSYDNESNQVCFAQQVSGALLARDAAAPIRLLRVSAVSASSLLLDQWVLLAMSAGAEEVDVDLESRARYSSRLCPFGPEEDSSADFSSYKVRVLHSLPRQLFSAGSSLRRLRLCDCKLDLPGGGVSLGSLETLVLKRLAAPEGDVQRVISSCPRLADLTLDQCPSVIEISVPSALLRNFAILCCHYAKRVNLSTRCLRSLTYRGSLLDESFFLLESCKIKSISIDICEDLAEGKTAAKAAKVMELVGRCTALTFLHLSLRPSMAYYSRMLVSTLGWLHGLRRLELKGCLTSVRTIHAVVDVLQSTNNLEELSLFPLDPEPAKKQDYYFDTDSEKEKIDYSCKLYYVPKGIWTSRIRCLQHRLRRIGVGNYHGLPMERTLVKLLLSKAQVLKELAVTFAAQCAPHQDELRSEMSSWLPNGIIKFTFVQGEN